MLYRNIIAGACLATATSVMMADTPHMTRQHVDDLIKNTKVIHIDGNESPEDKLLAEDSLRREMISFYYDQFRHFDNPAAPFFQFMSRDAHLTMGIGGVVRMRMYYGFGGDIPSPAFAPYLIPIPENPSARRHLGTTPAGTCIFFQVLGQNKVFGKYQLYIEANFNGYGSRDFHLKKAFARWRDFTLGLAPSTFNDDAAHPPMVDSNGPENQISVNNVLFRYMPSIGKHWVLAVSAESPSSPAQYTTDNSTCSSVSNWTPDLCAFVQYQWAIDQHVRLSGLYRTMPYRNLLQQSNHNVAGWGLQLSGVGRPSTNTTIYFSGSYGHGYTSVLNDLLMGSYDLMPDPLDAGRMYSPAAYGWNVGFQYNFRPNLFASVSGGQVRYLPRRAVAPTEYRFGQLLCVNMFWNPTPRTQFGIEYDWGRRVDQSHAQANAHRIGAVAQFSF